MSRIATLRGCLQLEPAGEARMLTQARAGRVVDQDQVLPSS